MQKPLPDPVAALFPDAASRMQVGHWLTEALEAASKCAIIGVCVGPGRVQFMRMPRLMSDVAVAIVQTMTASLENA